MLIQRTIPKPRAKTRKRRGIVCALIFCLNSVAYAEWKENCQSSYRPLEIAPALPFALQSLEVSRRPDAKALEDRLRAVLLKEAQQPLPIWNGTDVQDLTREVQEFLFQQKPEPELEPLRRHWILLLLAQRQWDVLGPALKNRDGSIALWQLAETRLGQQDYTEALRLFHQINLPELSLWLSFRKMETLFLLGESASALDQLRLVLGSKLFTDGRVREGFQGFLQAFAMRGRELRPLLSQLKEKVEPNATGQLAYCILKNSRDADDRGAALAAVLNLPEPNSQSLRLAASQLERMLVEPIHPDGLLNWLEAFTVHAATRFARNQDAWVGEDAFLMAETLQISGDFLLKNRSVMESPALLERWDQSLRNAINTLPPRFDSKSLLHMRARVLEQGHRYAEAARVYRELALAASTPSDQRLFANLMLKNFGFAATDLAADASFVDACRIYQRLVPESRQELSRCDLMMARQALSQGQSIEARQKLWQIVYAFPSTIEGQTAAERLIELSRPSADELLMTADKLLNIRNFQSGPWGHKLREIRRQSAYQRITRLASIDDQSEAFFVFSQKEKGDPLGSQGLLQAVRIDQQNGRPARAMDRLETWLQDYPASPEAPARLLELISMAEGAGQLSKARQYLQWTSNYTWAAEESDNILQKTCLFDILEQPLLALKSCEKLGDHLTQGPALRLRLARSLAYSGYSEPLQLYARDRLLPRQDLSVDQKMAVLDLLRKAASLTPTRDDDVKTMMTNYYLEQSDSLGAESRRILGGLAYQAAQKTLAPFQALPIHGTRSDELIGAIQAKKQAFDEIEALYNKVLQTKDPHWGSSALVDLALAAENFADGLSRIPEIEGVDRKKLMSQIASQLASWRAKAKSYAGSAAKTIDRFGILHFDNRRIIQEARRLRDDTIQFNDWLPSLLDAETEANTSSSWTSWDEVADAMLTASHQNAGITPTDIMIKALDFVMQKGDFIRAEWLNERLLNSQDPKVQALGAWQQGRLEARLDNFGKVEELWQKALAADPDHRALRKQLGLLYARFGFFAKSLQVLKPIEDESLVASTLVAMERQLELNEPADHRCESLTVPPAVTAEALFNCSLLEFQNHRNAGKAITWMQEALQAAEHSSALAAAARDQLAQMQIWKARFQPDR